MTTTRKPHIRYSCLHYYVEGKPCPNCRNPARKPRKARTTAASVKYLPDALRGLNDPPYTMHPKMKAKLKDYARRKLSPKQKVLRRWPGAVCFRYQGAWQVENISYESQPFGRGRTPALAWASAASRLKGKG